MTDQLEGPALAAEVARLRGMERISLRITAWGGKRYIVSGTLDEYHERVAKDSGKTDLLYAPHKPGAAAWELLMHCFKEFGSQRTMHHWALAAYRAQSGFDEPALCRGYIAAMKEGE